MEGGYGHAPGVSPVHRTFEPAPTRGNPSAWDRTINFVSYCVYIGGTCFTPVRLLALFLGLLGCLFILPQFLLAEEEEVYFSSDYQQEIQDEQVLLLQGNVEVHFRDVIIFADQYYYPLNIKDRVYLRARLEGYEPLKSVALDYEILEI